MKGKMATILVMGEEKFDSVEKNLQAAVDEFNAAVSNFGHKVGFKTHQVVLGTSLMFTI